MEENVAQAGVFLELRQRLQSGLLVVRSDVAGDLSEVTVSGREGSLRIEIPGGKLCVQLPPGVSLVQGSCREVSSTPGEGTHLRLRLQVDQHTDAPRSVMRKLQVKKSYDFSCQRCRERLLTERVFSRVLPLPNGNWNTLVEDWCCHPDPFANRKLLPRPADCLLGDTYFLLSKDERCDQKLMQESSPAQSDASDSENSGQKPKRVSSVLCRNCGAVLGEAIALETLKLYITETLVEPSNEGVLGKQHRRGVRVQGEHQSCAACSAVKVLYLPCAPSMHQE
ncbi:hypothetical protein JZ751_015598 [Albula glossodonta]|uniref:E3 ubiquitin-protein ligase E3D n=1 Tax=Albula glossodonta TaxID=121402 RepID=A0A8T2NT60_9TELE|nr:hypothetical protein JZ751_015598 [Albula glossodonta]